MEPPIKKCEYCGSVGHMPNRFEQALLFAHQRDQFDGDWYWSNTLHEADPDCAWYQYFYRGNQSYDYRNYEFRARSVRREYF